MWLPWGNNRRSNSGPGRGTRLSATTLKDLDALLPPPTPTSTSRASNALDGNTTTTSSATSYPESPIIHRTFSLRSSRRDSFDFSSYNAAEQGRPKQVIVYSTSFRAVRKTFEDCRTVLTILRGLRVFFDDRDVSMDARLLAELKTLLGGGKTRLSLPQVFIDGKRIGGAEEIRKLHESGELRRIVEGAPAAGGGTCRECGGARFVVCGTCEGSHKMYSEKLEKFRTCAMCNENGLVRCRLCVKAV